MNKTSLKTKVGGYVIDTNDCFNNEKEIETIVFKNGLLLSKSRTKNQLDAIENHFKEVENCSKMVLEAEEKLKLDYLDYMDCIGWI